MCNQTPFMLEYFYNIRTFRMLILRAEIALNAVICRAVLIYISLIMES